MLLLPHPKIERTDSGLYVIRLSNVPVINDRDWNQAIDAAAPQTPQCSLIRKIGHLYSPCRSGVSQVTLSILGFDREFESQEAQRHIHKLKLPAANPRQIFAIAEQNPTLHRMLGQEHMALLSFKTFKYKRSLCVPDLWFGGNDREAGSHLFYNGWNKRCWFVVVGNVR